MSDLARQEASILGTLLEQFPDPVPPVIAKLLRHAPESFDDLRNGIIAKTIFDLSAGGKAIHPAAVLEAMKGADVQFAYVTSLQGIPLDCAALEAGDVWESYRARRAKGIAGEMAQDIDAHPAKAGTIIKAALSTLASLTEETTGADLWNRLQGRRFDIHARPPVVVPRFYVRGVPVSTPGNITAMSGPPKSAKTAANCAMMAAAITTEPDRVDCLGFNASNTEGKALIHFDTEQSIEDHFAIMERTTRRAGLVAPPPWLLSHCLTEFSISERRGLIFQALQNYGKEFGGVHSLILDGVADFVHDVNDAEEANGFVSELHAAAITHACAIVVVIHLNPSTEKTRGHLGSQLERKAETNLRLEVDGSAVVLWSDKNRKAPITKAHGPRFAWSDEHRMHVSVESLAAAREEAETEELSDLAKKVFKDHPSMRRTDLETTVKKVLTVRPKTAERRTNRMLELGVIEKSVAGLYVMASKQRAE